MNDDEQHWTSWQRNDWTRRKHEYMTRTPPIQFEHRSAVYDDDPEEQDGGVVFWVMVGIIAIVILGIVALRFGHLLWSKP